MVVDDEESLVTLEKEILELNGYQVTTCTDSLAALAAFQQEPARFAAVITDQTMPRMTGMELAGAMLELRPDMPVILATGYSETVGEAEVLAAGLRGYLTKPLDVPRLLELLESVIDRSAPGISA
jgi:DNA-binding NtrC family response regulator